MNREDVIRWMQEVGAKESNLTPQTYDGFVDIFQHFAELIVRECANLFDKDEMELTLTERTIHNTIKEHFGVEE